jgi:hypothetical protein
MFFIILKMVKNDTMFHDSKNIFFDSIREAKKIVLLATRLKLTHEFECDLAFFPGQASPFPKSLA